MSRIVTLIEELKMESAATERVLEAIPAESLGWKPHEKSMTIGQLAFHVATIPSMMTGFALVDVFEIPMAGMPQPESKEALLTAHREGLETAIANLQSLDSTDLPKPWTAKLQGVEILTVPRSVMLRMFVLNHLYHHRGQLTVNLRLLDAPVPSVYGPTADINPFAELLPKPLSH